MTIEHPFLNPSLDIQWSQLNSKHVVPDMEKALEVGQAAIESILSIPAGKETFQNTFLALEDATNLVSRPWGKISHLTSVNDHPELRAAHRQMLQKVSAFFSAIPLNRELYKKLRQYADSPEAKKLDTVEKRFVRETLTDFEDSGANLDDSTRARLKEIESQLAEQTKNYSDHVLDSTNAYERIVEDVRELRGLPESSIEASRLDALAKGIGTPDAPKYRLTLHAPSIIPALRFLESDALRKELFEALCQVGHSETFENEPLIREILALRKEKACLLGRDIFPDWVLSRRMAKSGKKALAFVEDLQRNTKAAFDRENKELMDFKAAKTQSEPGALNQWEAAFWSEHMRKDRFDFDEELLRPYFPIESVMKGMFQLVERLFAIRVEEITNPKPETWHDEVKVYSLHDIATNQHLGTFYSDWHPRESKRGGAWMGPLITGGPEADGTFKPHLGYIIGNLTPPVGDTPALLNHREVETVFHEFGHLLHHLLSEVKIRSLAGTNVAWDFVELPSQIMENWCWERESLDFFARHYETGETIPEDLFQKMQKARTFGAGRMQMRQLALGKMDLAMHMEFDDKSSGDLDAFIDEALEGYLSPVNIKYPSNVRAFGHLFSSATGYASGYYSYKWAEVLDADAFTRFTKEGILNPTVGRQFRDTVLAKGNSEEPNILFQAFMGRDPDPTALLRRLGLLASA